MGGDRSVEERLAAIEHRLDRLTTLIEGRLAAVEPTIAMAADAVDEWAAEQTARGVDIDAHARQALVLVGRLTDPLVAARLERLVELLPQLTPVMELAATFQPTTAMVFDMVDEQARRLEHRGIDLEQRIGQVLVLVERLTDPAFHAHLSELLDAAPGLMHATRTGERFGRAVDRVTAGEPPQPLGVLGLVRALSHPDVQRAVGFAVAVAEQVGRTLPTTSAPART